MSSGSWTDTRRRLPVSRPRLRHLRSPRVLIAVLAVLLILGLGWLWFRGSSFVRIKTVTVTGLSGPDIKQIRAALTTSAESMTTMNVSLSKLNAAVAGYPVVTALKVSTHYPHGATIAVVEQVPVATVRVDGRTIVVDADGQLLPDSTVAHGLLPTLALGRVPVGERITAPGAVAAIEVLKAAPYALISKVANATNSSAHGVILQLRDGPQLYFGSPGELALKWVSATAVLGNSESEGAAYIDVSDPHRPAAGA